MIVSNSQDLPASGILGNTIVSRFKTTMDQLLTSSRDVTIHLEPQKIACSSGCKFNSAYKKYIGANGQLCRTCRGDGFQKEPRQTVYKANIRWTNEPYDKPNRGDQNSTGGRIGVNFVRTKMQVTAFDHIKQAIGATIDGVNVKLFQEPRKTGFGDQLLYVVAWWEVK